MAQSDAFYLEIVGEVNDALLEFGTSYKVRTKGTYDSTTLSRAPGPEREVLGLVTTQQEAHSLAPIAFPVTETSAAWRSTKVLLLSATSEPRPEEEVLVDGKWHPLSKVQKLKPADITIMFTLDLVR